MNKKKKETSLNPQDILAESLEGIYLVDAGAGTGKTHTIIRRYRNLIDKGIDPEKILMITFTRNAADQMRDDVISNISSEKHSITDFLEAPIMNFHSFCTRLIKKSGANAPLYLGIRETLLKNFAILEDNFYESEIFRKFFYGFRKITLKKYGSVYMTLNDNHESVLSLIRKLSSRGIFPLEKGWFNDGEKILKGDFDLYSEIFDKKNAVKPGSKDAEVQNDLYKIFNDIRKNLYTDYDFESVVDGKRIKAELKSDIFENEKAAEFIEFIREIYLSYIEYLLKKNTLNFDFVVMFAFLILYNDEGIREKYSYDYVMVDEFQDTDEIQFLLLMLLCRETDGKANIAVVGDWKQGIYGFRNTTIENITKFTERLSEYREVLNNNKQRITFDVSPEKIIKIVFEYNYRSSQKILDFSRNTLLVEATQSEVADFETVANNFKKPLTAKRELDDMTEIGFYRAKESDSDSEVEMVLKKISELTNDEKYRIREFDSDGKKSTERKVRYSDICVLARKKSFGLKLQRAGMVKGIPVNYEGGLELFATKQAILVLAWFRLILNEKNIDGWLPVLETEGYNFEEISTILNYIKDDKFDKVRNVLSELLYFREELTDRRANINFITEAILNRYGYKDEYANAILTVVNKWTKTDLISLSELTRLIDKSSAEKFNIEINKSENAVVSQTIHSAKGLEYPVVILADLNTGSFPSTKNTINDLYFHPVSGLRFRKEYGVKGEHTAIFNNWRSDILISMMKPDNHDEERRLLYVAVTRAKQYLFFTAYKPSRFFELLSERSGIAVVTNIDTEKKPADDWQDISVEELKIITVPLTGKKFVSVHAKMDEFDKTEEDYQQIKLSGIPKNKGGRYEYGISFHRQAQKLAYGADIKSSDELVNNIKKFINELDAEEIRSEVDFLYPKENEIIRGTIDLLAFYEDRIEVIDYKTDAGKKNIDKYNIQMNLYKEVIEKIYPDMKVIWKLYFVRLGEIMTS
ncbi:MAG TPA: UvrD-helicase domain-containing protein [Ignavibacteria bacterium]|nr:UvrD-helicase domain-containing protein [Ignavibacteria bacterium]